uniref:Uncharacterized protein n=1 Tax=Rhizophora mucronata TaxID=61149 RepID=A0A2P2PDP3_RHIMU
MVLRNFPKQTWQSNRFG